MTRPHVADDADRGREPPIGLRRLWFGVAAAPLAWMVAELAGYVLASRDCGRWQSGLAAHAVPNAPVIVTAISLAMAALAAAGLAVALGGLRTTDRVVPPSDVRAGRARFMSVAGVLVSALLLVGIVFFSLPPFLVNACSRAR
jgi:hypothetical protein